MKEKMKRWFNNFFYFTLPASDGTLLKYIVLNLEEIESGDIKTIKKKIFSSVFGVFFFLAIVSIIASLLGALPQTNTLLWINPQKHSLIETFNGLIAIIIALILAWEYSISGRFHVFFLVLAFLSMGIMDIFHAHVNFCHNMFVWFHSAGAFLGGLFFVASTFNFEDTSENESPSVWPRRLYVLLGGILLLVCAILIIRFYAHFPDVLVHEFPHHTSADHATGQFVGFIHTLNFLSGLFFLSTGLIFLKSFFRTNDIIYLIFGGASLLFSESEFLFFYSQLWDPAWWFWHAIKSLVFSGLLLGLAYGFTRTFYGLYTSRMKMALFLEEIEKKNIELKTAYADMKETQRYLTESERLASIGKMAATLAHEIKNPLGAITNSLGVLTNYSTIDDTNKELVQIIEGEMERLNRLVEDFQSFSRPPRLNKIKTDIHELIDEVLSFMLMDGDIRAMISIIKNFAADIPPLMVDRNRMKQILINVLLNGIQALPAGGKITITTKYKRSESEVEITITDTGTGISEDVLPQVFQPFFTTKDKGLGLGLNIVYKTAKEHGGYITISSQKGEGTQVRLNLPTIINGYSLPAG